MSPISVARLREKIFFGDINIDASLKSRCENYPDTSKIWQVGGRTRDGLAWNRKISREFK